MLSLSSCALSDVHMLTVRFLIVTVSEEPYIEGWRAGVPLEVQRLPIAALRSLIAALPFCALQEIRVYRTEIALMMAHQFHAKAGQHLE